MKFNARWMAAPVISAVLVLAACATIGPPEPPSLELPKPVKDLRATRKGDRVILTWTVPTITTDRKKIRDMGPTRICRGAEPLLVECGTPAGQAPPWPTLSAKADSNKKVSASYTDALSGQTQTAQIEGGVSGFMTYAVEPLNTAGRGGGLSNQVRVPLAGTLPPPRNFGAQVTAQGVVLTWDRDFTPGNFPSSARYVYRVYRREEGSQQSTLVGEVPLGNTSSGTRSTAEPALSLTDSRIDWEKTYQYRAETVTVIVEEKIAQENKAEIQVEGDDTPDVKVFTHDVFPPAVPTGLQAGASGPGQKTFIDLVWAPVTDADLDGYNVYRHQAGTAPVRMNAALVKSPAYRDESVAAGNHYSYSVSAVDVRGNESVRSDEAGEAVP